MRFNRIYNKYRKFRGKKPFSLSAWAKAKVKSAVNHVHRYEDSLANMARKHKCEGMICGHIHVAADRIIEGIHYLNSGDWVNQTQQLSKICEVKCKFLIIRFLRNLSLIKEQATFVTSRSIKRKKFQHRWNLYLFILKNNPTW